MNSKIALSFLALFLGSASFCWGENLTLSTAYELALKNEPHLRAMALKTIAGAEGIEQSKARLYPQVQGSFSWGRYEYQYTTANREPIKEDYTSYAISATQPVYHPELWRSVDESKARQKAAEFQLQADAQQLGLDLAKAYFNLLYTQRNVELIEAQKGYYDEKFKQLERMLQFGLTNRIDLLETKVQRDKTTSEWLSEKKKYQVSKLKLEHMIGENIGEVESFDFEKIDTDRLLGTQQEWEAEISENPMLKAAVANEEATRHNVAVREYDHYPKVDLSLTRKETYTQDVIAHKYDNQAIAQMTIPIYQGGYTQSRVREGRLLLDSAIKDRDYYQKDALYQFEALWAERELNIETIKVLKESEKSASLYLQSVEKGHTAGLKSLVDVLEARAKVFDVRRQQVEAGYQLINNQLGLLNVTGKLNVENIADFERVILKK